MRSISHWNVGISSAFMGFQVSSIFPMVECVVPSVSEARSTGPWASGMTEEDDMLEREEPFKHFGL